MLDQLLGGAGESGVSYEQATGLLGYTPDALLDQVVDAFAAGDAHEVFATIDKVMDMGQDPRRFAEDLLRRLGHWLMKEPALEEEALRAAESVLRLRHWDGRELRRVRHDFADQVS